MCERLSGAVLRRHLIAAVRGAYHARPVVGPVGVRVDVVLALDWSVPYWCRNGAIRGIGLPCAIRALVIVSLLFGDTYGSGLRLGLDSRTIVQTLQSVRPVRCHHAIADDGRSDSHPRGIKVKIAGIWKH